MKNKRKELKHARREILFRYHYIEKPEHERECEAKLGYRYLRIAIEDVDTGVRKREFFTFRKPEECEKLIRDLVEAAALPDELQEITYPTMYEKGEWLLDRSQTLKQLFRRQLLGGRKKGIPEERAKKYEKIREAYETYRQSGGTSQEDFCEREGIKMSRFRTARGHG